VRPFEAVLANPGSLPDLRVLAGIAEELDTPLGFRTVADVRAQLEDLGEWDGPRASMTPVEGLGAEPPTGAHEGGAPVRLATWKQMIDHGSMQDGDEHLHATARQAVARVSPTVYAAVGPTITVTGDRGSVTLPAEPVDDLVDGVVWVPANSFGNGVLSDLASPGSRVTVKGATS